MTTSGAGSPTPRAPRRRSTSSSRRRGLRAHRRRGPAPRLEPLPDHAARGAQRRRRGGLHVPAVPRPAGARPGQRTEAVRLSS